MQFMHFAFLDQYYLFLSCATATLATRHLGIWFNLKMVLYLGSLGKSENKGLI